METGVEKSGNKEQEGIGIVSEEKRVGISPPLQKKFISRSATEGNSV